MAKKGDGKGIGLLYSDHCGFDPVGEILYHHSFVWMEH